MLAAIFRFVALGTAFGVAVASAYKNAHDELAISAALKLRYTCAWSALPVFALLVYFAGVVASNRLSLNYRPVLSLTCVYAVVFGAYALNGPTDPNSAGHMHFMFVPIFLTMFSLPFHVFMIDRVVSIVREGLRPRKPDNVIPLQKTH